MQRRKEAARLLAVAGALMLTAAACGGGDGGEGGGGDSARKALVVGTTDAGVVSIDPAGSYDLPSSMLQYNIYQTLMKIPAGGNKPVPDAAQSCEFTDPKTYQCTMKDGLKFSNGNPLTSADVKFSYDRLIKINDPNGTAAAIYGTATEDGSGVEPAATVETPDPKTVIFKLKQADATWPAKISYSASGIVDHTVYPADAKLDNAKIVGSGPYQLTRFQKNQQAVFEANPNYVGDTKAKVPNVIVRYYQQSSALKLGVEQGEVDVAYRNLSPTEFEALKGASNKGVKVVAGNGTEIRYLVLNVEKAPFDQKAVRQALAQVINREDIATNVYNGTVQPLYTMVPQGLDGHYESFKEKYGTPDPAKAKALVEDAGLTTPVPITMWYSPSHYGPATADELNQVKRTLDESGVFKVTLKNSEWEQYQEQYDKQVFQVFQLGWFPDYPDPDNYLSPFLIQGGFFNQNYNNPGVNKLISEEQQETDLQKRLPKFEEIQKTTAEDVPLIPLWQAKQVAAVRDGVTGVETTFDPSFTFRFYVIDKQ